MEQALRDVQQSATIDAEIGQRCVEGAEVVVRGFVSADVLGGDDRRELAPQPPVAGGEPCAVHVGQDDQLVMTTQAGQRLGGPGKGGQLGTESASRCAHTSLTGVSSVSPVRLKAMARMSGYSTDAASRSTAASLSE